MAQITPPVGFNLFVLQGLTKRDVTWIARTAWPLFVLMMAAVMLTYFVPDVVLWLPRQMQS
ncbi:TRAP transporter, DctM subunit [compost metagenome]